MSCSWPVHPDQALAEDSALFIYLSIDRSVHLFIYLFIFRLPLPQFHLAVSVGCSLSRSTRRAELGMESLQLFS